MVVKLIILNIQSLFIYIVVIMMDEAQYDSQNKHKINKLNNQLCKTGLCLTKLLVSILFNLPNC